MAITNDTCGNNMTKSFKNNRGNNPTCSFCSIPKTKEVTIISGPGAVFICSNCVKISRELIRDGADAKKALHKHAKTVPTPQQIKQHLDQYIIGQDQAKKRLSVAVYNHYRRLENSKNVKSNPDEVEIQKSNLLLIGPTGTGKTLLAQTLAKFLQVPFATADATTLTEAGYVGEDVENIILNLYRAAGENIEKTMRGIVFVDEIDKLAKKGTSSSAGRDVSGEGVQQALLKIIEGTMANIQSKDQKRLGSASPISIDTTNILFICGGAFEGLDKIIEQRTGKGRIGFLQEAPVEEDRIVGEVSPEDLDRFGLIPEFVGRLPVIAAMTHLDQVQLMDILTKPKNALVKQYQKLFREEKIQLNFTEEALVAIAQKAIERKTGARGLRTILEEIMLDIMYEAPSEEGLQEVSIGVETVLEGQPPKCVYHAKIS